jgi:CBS domain-containing protein
MFADQILDRKGRDVATIAPEASVADALQLLAEANVGALVVSTTGTTVEGILSERDIVRRLARDGAACIDLAVSTLMITDVVTCGGHTDSAELMSLMTGRRIRHLPVVDGGELRGLVSIGDVVKTRIDELATEREQLVGYIQHGR